MHCSDLEVEIVDALEIGGRYALSARLSRRSMKRQKHGSTALTYVESARITSSGLCVVVSAGDLRSW